MNMRYFLGFFLVILLVTGCHKSSTSQKSKPVETATVPNVQLPKDSNLVVHQLDNGFTYYLYPTDVVKDKASYYIIQNVGSVLENDSQKGLAHFLEHMAFNGTDNYPDKKFLETMQLNGLVFGRDINAYTSFDETVYNVNNVPTTPEMTQHGLQILYDWANGLLLTDEEIDNERGVILEEWRTRRTGALRIFEQQMPVRYGRSLYADRMPIGDTTIVLNFNADTLRQFYHDWYRTDLQAIAIVGDIDTTEMKKQIEAKFSQIPAVTSPKPRPEIIIPDRKALDYALAIDPEVSSERIMFAIRRQAKEHKGTTQDVRQDLIDDITSSVYNERMEELRQNPDVPFENAGLGTSKISRNYEALSMSITPKPNQQKAAFELAYTELMRLVKYGPTQAELARQKANITTSYENYIKQLNDRSHYRLVNSIKQNYLQGEAITDPVAQFDLVKKILPTITTQTIKQNLDKEYTDNNRTLLITGVAGNQNLSQAQAEDIIQRIENDPTIEAKAEEEEQKQLIDDIPDSRGDIAQRIEHADYDFTEYVLSNGIHVYYKYSDKDENEVVLNATSEGGWSLLDQSQYFNAQLVGGLDNRSGTGSMTLPELNRFLSDKSAFSSASVGELHEGISGFSSTDDAETLFQLTNLHFTKPRLDSTTLALMKQQMNNKLIKDENDIHSKMRDSIKLNTYGDHPARQILTKELINTADHQTIQSIYNQRFANAADFNFYLVGDISQEEAERLMKEYLAGLPTNAHRETWRQDYRVDWVKPNIKKQIPMVMENAKTTVNIVQQKEMPFSLRNKYLSKIVGSLLQQRYTETLREDEGGTYGAGVAGSFVEEPKSYATVRIYFDANPELTDKLIGIVYNEIDKLKQGQIDQEDFDKTISSMLKDREENRQVMNYDLGTIQTIVEDGYNPDAAANYEDIISSFTIEDVQDFAKKLFSEDGNKLEIVFVPK